MLQAGFAREVITPTRGIPLVGYFNPRPNTGALDDLFVKALLFEQDKTVAGLVVFDLCFPTSEMIENITRKLNAAGIDFGDKLIFSATHTHTGPYVTDFFGFGADAEYLKTLENKTFAAIKQAFANLAEAELHAVSVNDNPFAFNRRYWMKNGGVLTNPGKLNPNIAKPEGPVDDEISILAVKQDGRITALVANIVNHTDTIGGNLVSADWPGRMEHALQNALGYDVPALTLIGCSGNINHFDVADKQPQSSYSEACRIGDGYAKIIAGQLSKMEKLNISDIQVSETDFVIPYRVISDAETATARQILAKVDDTASDADMTSEGLAKGEGPVARFFADQLLAFHKNCSGKERTFKLLAIKLGSAVFVSIPGEPFTEIGLAVKTASAYKYNFITTLGMGECGYVPLPECFERGGYEILPIEGGGPREDTALRLTDALIQNIDKK